MDHQYFHHAFLKYTQNNLEYLIQNMTYLKIQINHSMLELMFQIYCYCMGFLCFAMCNKY